MKPEIPESKRCCCCLPLRYGLLAWGYFKMTTDVILLSILICSIIQTDDFSERELILTSIAIVIFITDVAVTIVFIFGGHKKKVKLIRAFYFYSILMWVIICLMTGFILVTAIEFLIAYEVRYWLRVLLPVSFSLVVLAAQSYFLILLRSEVINLRNNGEFRFLNNTAEAECTMTSEEKVVGEESVKEVVIN